MPRSSAQILALVPLFVSVAAGAARVTGVQFATSTTATRVTIEVSGEFEHKWDRLRNPDRAFFDVLEATPLIKGHAKGIYTVTVGDSRLKQIRVAQSAPGRTRVVLDLEPGVEIQVSRAKSPERLVVELTAKGAVAPAAPVSPAPTVSKRFVPPPFRRAALPPVRAPEAPPVLMTRMGPRPQIPVARPVVPPFNAPRRENSRPVEVAKADLEPTIPRPEPTRPEPPVNVGPPAPPKSAAPDATPVPAKKNMLGDRSMTRILGLKLRRVVIDAGHGGQDHGTTGVTGLREKDLVLDLALRLGALVQQELGAEVVYTRQDDTFIPLERRTQIANEAHADLFISLHANSSPVAYVNGIETYVLSFTTDRLAMEVAARENASSGKNISDLADLVRKIAAQDKLKESTDFALRVQQALVTGTGPNTKARNRGVRRAPFIVLIGAQMPSILAEVGFLSNAKEEELFKTSAHRDKVAQSLLKGIVAYANSLSRFQVASAPGALPTRPATGQ
jgi:N-acetylmuramoyl-L-alanine amidase